MGAYVNATDAWGALAVSASILVSRTCSLRVVRLLVDAVADTTSAAAATADAIAMIA